MSSMSSAAESALSSKPNESLKTPGLHGEPKVIGIYGISGCGKSYLLRKLQEHLDHESYSFYEGSDMIRKIFPDDFNSFDRLDEDVKKHWREQAILQIKEEATISGKVAIVTGHYMFWSEGEEEGVPVCTKSDLASYTHILYLHVPGPLIAHRRMLDTDRLRPYMSIAHLDNWQQTEINQLRSLCSENHFLFTILRHKLMSHQDVSHFIRSLSYHSEKDNLSRAAEDLDLAIKVQTADLKTVLMIDADKTLFVEDSGVLFWKKLLQDRSLRSDDLSLDSVFGGHMGYSYRAFVQAALLYEEMADEEEFESLCEKVATEVTIRSEFVAVLEMVAETNSVSAIIVTSGLRRVCEKVLTKAGLHKIVRVIGGGRISDRYVVTAAVKGALVSRLRNVYKLWVCAFGDSPLDLEMLKNADQAIVVVGDEEIRSKSMDTDLSIAINRGGLRASQLLSPRTVRPRLDISQLPLIQLSDHGLMSLFWTPQNQYAKFEIYHATDKSAAKLLMTPMRDSSIAGPRLREAHRQVGWYLAIKFLSKIVGVERCAIQHVQNHATDGYRLLNEAQTTVIALMRGGEAMALGVSDAIPLAMFVHANNPADVMAYHVQKQRTIVLVDSVVNTGKTALDFIRHIHSINSGVHIVLVAGVVQSKFTSSQGLSRTLTADVRLSLITLRFSDNKFSGRGTTDTGNRLFNTTNIE